MPWSPAATSAPPGCRSARPARAPAAVGSSPFHSRSAPRRASVCSIVHRAAQAHDVFGACSGAGCPSSACPWSRSGGSRRPFVLDSCPRSSWSRGRGPRSVQWVPVHTGSNQPLSIMASLSRHASPRLAALPASLPRGSSLDQALQLLVEQAGDELLSVGHGASVARRGSAPVAVTHALGDHQPVDAVGREVLHVAVEQARALAVEHAVPVADHGAHRGARAGDSALADAGRRAGAGPGSGLDARRPRPDLVGRRELCRPRSRSGRDARSRRRP